MLVEGIWTKDWDPVQKADADGRFIRESSAFRQSFSASDIKGMKCESSKSSSRFRLYVVYICPWATRALIARSLLGLESYIDVIAGEPEISDFGWQFKGENEHSVGSHSNAISGIDYMHELYTKSDPKYTGRATVPVIWDSKKQHIVNNESAEILRLFNHDLRPVHQSDIDLYPTELQTRIDEFNQRIYHNLNNGVYRAGFAQTQLAYHEAMNDIFECLEWLERHFSTQDWAVGQQLTESDIRLFVTLSRFDVAYFGLFKTNRKSILDFPSLSAYMDRLFAIPAFSSNTRVDHIKRGYYSIKKLNPTGIVPDGPILPWFRFLNDQ